MLTTKKLAAMAFATALLPMAGCQQQAPLNHGEEFTPEEQVSQVTKLEDVQAARGARSDATLYAIHFDGDHLSTLGMAKLDLMLKDDSALPIKVWLAVPDDGNLEGRREAINAYLKDRGVAADQVVLERGANPDTDHPAAKGLTDLANMDSSSSSGSSSSSTSTPGSSPGGAAPGATPGTP
jgi:hypothetical protein